MILFLWTRHTGRDLKKMLKPDTMIIVEASLDTDFSYLDELGFSVIKFKKYKTNMHVFIQQKRV